MSDSKALAESYRLCRSLNYRHGKTYFYATQLLDKTSRPGVHALYGFCRYVDDIVDDLGPISVQDRIAAVDEFETRFYADLSLGESEDRVLRAVVDTVMRYHIDRSYFERFLRSMKMDFQQSRYQSFEDLMEYVDGSAAVIGEMTLPILAPDEVAEATPYARDLGVAFQLTNFLRDVSEDYRRGRIYLPMEDVERFGALDAITSGRVTSGFCDLMRYEISRCRELYKRSMAGDHYLRGRSRKCVVAARGLYGAILDRIELLNYDVFTNRAKVPTFQKLITVSKLAILSK